MLSPQAAFLSPPAAMNAFDLKGVAPRHVARHQSVAGMLPFMTLVLLPLFPAIGMWLPERCTSERRGDTLRPSGLLRGRLDALFSVKPVNMTFT